MALYIWIVFKGDSNLLMPVAATLLPDYNGGISLTKAMFKKYLKENCSSELYLQLSFKYFSNLSFILKLSSKVWQVQTREILTVQASLIYDMIDSVMKGSTAGMGCFQKVQIVHLE